MAAQTVAEMLSAAPAQTAAPSDAPPPGFVVANDAPAPPPGFQVQGGDSAPSFVKDLIAPAQSAFQALKTDAARYAAAAKAGPKGPQDLIPGVSQQDRSLGSMAGDLVGLVTSPVAGALNAAVVQPGARVLDQLPAPLDPHNGFKPMTPAQQHAANANIIGTALMALGPKGIKGGAVADAMTQRYAAKVADVVTKVPPEVALDEAGDLTPEAHEAAAQSGVHPEDLKAGYEAVQQAREAPVPPDAAPAPEAVQTPPAEPVEAAAPIQPQGDLQTPPSAAPEAAPAAPATAPERLAQAASEGVDLTKGQATQDFATQEQEQTLLGQPSAEGTAARQFFAQQQQQIANAVDQFKTAIGSRDLSPVERGQIVQDAMRDLRDSGRAGVSQLYKQAQSIADGLGDNASNLVRLENRPLLDAMRAIWTDESISPQVRNGLKQQAAQYGLIGDTPRTFEDGSVTVRLRDSEGQPGPPINLARAPEPLTISNAEDLRQAFNRMFDETKSAAVLKLKPVLDEAVQNAVERAVSEGQGDLGEAFKAARAAHQTQQQTFAAKDVVQKLIDWKVRGVTPTVLPENAVKTIFAGGKDAVTDLKKVKAVLLNKPTEKSKAAWQAIQAHAVADIFDKALTLNARMDGGELGAISGAKLNTAIAKFGADKLKVLLPESDFNQLMKLRRIIGDATIPIQRTMNPSGTAQKVIQFLAGQGAKMAGVARFVPGVGPIVDTARGLYTVGKETGQAKATLAGMRDFTPEAAAKADAPQANPADYARKFIKVAGSDEVLAPLIASAANEQSR